VEVNMFKIENVKGFANLGGLLESIITIAAQIFTTSKLHLRFKDRAAAASILADILKSRFDKTADNKQGIIVLGIPRGGVIIADVIARKLHADFDIVIGKKLLDPNDKQNAIGAVVEDGTIHIDQKLVNSLQISQEYIDKEKSDVSEEIKHMMAAYRGKGTRDYKAKDRIVILVDDGAATGATIITAARFIKKQQPKRLIIAVPVAPRQTVALLRGEADVVEVITSPSNFKTVGQFYQNFIPVTHGQVIEIMQNRNLLL
jgi:putative phosphoribosyl transferase